MAYAGAVGVHETKLGSAAAQIAAIEIPAEDGVGRRKLAIENIAAETDADARSSSDFRMAGERVAHPARRYFEDLVDVAGVLDVKMDALFVQRNSSCSG